MPHFKMTHTIQLTLALTLAISAIHGQKVTGWKADSTGCEALMVEFCKKENEKYRKFTIIRTSNNDSLLKRYVNNFRCCGGERYIVTLQQKFKLIKLNDTTYQIKIKDKGSLVYEDESDWEDFLWCPIGKPNGTIILIDGDDIKRREYNYKNEMKEGRIVIWNRDGTLLGREDIYNKDIKIE